MSTDTTAASTENLEQRLQRSIDALCENAACVEVWATALSAFAHPIPGYEWSERFRLGTSANGGRQANFGT